MKKRLIVSAITILACCSEWWVFAVDAKGEWQSQWEQTVEAAKHEGQLNVYLSYDGFLKEFNKAYPDIKTLSVTGKGSVLFPRIMAERRAGKHLADVMVSGAFPPYPEMYQAKILAPVRRSLVLPEVTDQSKWYQGKHEYVDRDGQFVFLHTSNPRGGSASYNTNLVDPKDFKSYWDFLDPKWKGKIVVFDPQAGRAQIRFLFFSPELGKEYLAKLLGEMDITVTRNRRQPVDWLSVGKFALCLFCQQVTDAKAQGLPVDDLNVQWKEGIDSSAKGYGVLSLIKDHPHPNAAKVFINWFLSRKGQLAFQKSFAPDDAPNSLRIDIPKDYLPPSSRRQVGVNYVNMERAEWLEARSDVSRFVREILRRSAKKARP